MLTFSPHAIYLFGAETLNILNHYRNVSGLLEPLALGFHYIRLRNRDPEKMKISFGILFFKIR